MRSRSKRLAWILAAAVILLVAAAVSYERLLRGFGRLLLAARPPEKAEAIVVVAGGWRGERILKASELASAGYAPLILMSDPQMRYYGDSECRLAIVYARTRGWDRAPVQCVTTYGNSTREESRALIEEIRRRGIRRFLIVTSDFHTARTAYVYRHEAPDLEAVVVAAPSIGFQLDRWWTNREGRKTVFMESVKHIGERLGL